MVTVDLMTYAREHPAIYEKDAKPPGCSNNHFSLPCALFSSAQCDGADRNLDSHLSIDGALGELGSNCSG